jgi:hypothetical protein
MNVIRDQDLFALFLVRLSILSCLHVLAEKVAKAAGVSALTSYCFKPVATSSLPFLRFDIMSHLTANFCVH